jgi:hypothetical protein
MGSFWDGVKSLRWRGRLAYRRISRLWFYRFHTSRLGKICESIGHRVRHFRGATPLENPRIAQLSELREIGAADLLVTWLGLPELWRNDTQIATLVLKHFLSEEWVLKHVDPDATQPGPLTLTGSPTDIELAKMRVVELAEAIFNLQKIDGITECINRLRTTNDLEPTIAELHIGKMIYANGWPFVFVRPRPGRTYDFEIQYGEWKVAADAKYKADSPVPDSEGIRKALGRSRSQLPKDGPGIFFVKLPPQWMDHPGWQEASVRGALNFFAQGTGRVCSVVFYLEPIHLTDFVAEEGRHHIASQGHYFREVVNPGRRYGRELDWKLWDKWRPTDYASWSALPPHYARLFEFPRGIIHLVAEAATHEQRK